MHPGRAWLVFYMQVSVSRWPWAGLLLLLGCCGLLLAGCKSTPKVDWNSRIGYYTYDQAVMELGPPNAVARLTNGNTVADWVTGQTGGGGWSVGTGVGVGPVGVGVGRSLGSSPTLRVLRLVFGPDNKLVSVGGNP